MDITSLQERIEPFLDRNPPQNVTTIDERVENFFLNWIDSASSKKDFYIRFIREYSNIQNIPENSPITLPMLQTLDWEGFSALQYAVIAGNKDVISYIIDIAKEDFPFLLNSRNCHGLTALHYSIAFLERGSQETSPQFNRKIRYIIHMLLDYEANPNIPVQLLNGRWVPDFFPEDTILSIAARKGDIPLTKLLLKHDAKISMGLSLEEEEEEIEGLQIIETLEKAQAELEEEEMLEEKYTYLLNGFFKKILYLKTEIINAFGEKIITSISSLIAIRQ